jgi:hypothetical protein
MSRLRHRVGMFRLPLVELLAPLGTEFNFFSDSVVFDSAFGRQLPSLWGFFPLTGSYPGPASVLFLSHDRLS